MTTRTSDCANPSGADEKVWRAAGAAWGTRAADWAYLMEPGLRRLYKTVHERAGVDAGTLLLDLACGAGMALEMAADRGAVVSGLDASAGMLAIAQARTPRADLREGTMFELPFSTSSFDVVTSFNGIWADGEAALGEARRVLRPGGTMALGYFGSEETCPDLEVIRVLQTLQAPADANPSRTRVRIAEPGAAQTMLEEAGFTVTDRGLVETITEWPDPDIAWRAWASVGGAFAAIANSGEEAVRAAVIAVLEPLHNPGVGIRVSAEYAYVIARLDAGPCA
ncbi:MAG: class I SAM-dependent methyltransferase [Acidimicrobiales bacterium]